MKRRSMKLTAFMILISVHAHAKGAPAFTDDRWNPAHVNSLAPVLKARLKAMSPVCGPLLEAEHMIATYIRAGDAEYTILHFEHLHCDNRAAICNDGRCLHEVYRSRGNETRRILEVYAHEISLNRSGDRAVVEFHRGWGTCCAVELP